MWQRLIVIFGIFDLIFGVAFLIGMSVDSPLRPIISAPFCQGEVIVRSYGDSDNFYCLEGDFERDITLPVVLIAMVGIGGGIMVIIFGAFVGTFVSMSRQSRILKDGEPGKARILEVKTTGIRINGIPLFDVVLEVMPDYQQPYETTARIRVGMFEAQYLQMGSVIPVMVDRKNPQHVAINLRSLAEMGMPAPVRINVGNASIGSGETLTEKLKQLEQSRDAGLISQQEYDELRQRILDELYISLSQVY